MSETFDEFYPDPVSAIILQSRFEHARREPENSHHVEGHFRVVRMIDEAQMRHEDNLFAQSSQGQSFSFLRPLVDTETGVDELKSAKN